MAKPLRQSSRKLIKRQPLTLREFLDPEYLAGGRVMFWASCLLLLISAATFIVVFNFVQELIEERGSPPSLVASANIALPYRPPDMTQILMWGHGGQGVTMNVSKLFEGHREEYQSGLQTFGLNKYLSDRISMRRSLPDVRSDQCLNNTSFPSLLNASIIVVFRTEPRTTLLRMLYSVVDRSPPQHVREIILVDDNTDLKDLKYPQLEHYLAHLKQVSILRLIKNYGYARARMLAARRAKGRVLVFLQPRVECTEGWLTPLLQTLASNLSTLAVPTVDDIDPLTFQYTANDSRVRLGSFNWDLTPRKREIPLTALSGPTTLNPVLVDGVFAVRREDFFRLGGLDQNLTRASSVDMELSFRSWMCGAGIELVRCSHLGLISRYNKQSGLELEKDDEKWEDNVRIAEMWLGDYKQFVYERIGVGILQYQRPELSKFQHSTMDWAEECLSFSWFLQQVEPSMLLPLQIDMRGQIVSRSMADRVLAIGYRGGFVSLVDLRLKPGPFFWYLLRSGALITENKMCLSYSQYSTASTNQTNDEQFFQHDSLQSPPKSPLNLTSSYSELNVSTLEVGLSQDRLKKDSDSSIFELNKVKNERDVLGNMTRPKVNNSAQRDLGLESDDNAVTIRSIQSRHDASQAQLRESGQTDTPMVRLGRQTDIPIVRLGGQTDTPMVRQGGLTDTPMVRLGGQTDTPMVRQGGQTDTTMVRLGRQTATPMVRQGGQTDTPMVRQGGQTETPMVRLGRQTDTPMVRLGRQTDTPMVRQGGQTDTPMVRLGGQTDTPMVRQGGQTDTPMVRLGRQTDTPMVTLGGQTDTPVVRQGGQTDTPMVRQGGQTDTPMVRQSGQTDTPMHRLGGQTDTPIVGLGDAAGNMTLLVSYDGQSETRLMLEPCPTEDDGQSWSYSDAQTLQHVSSGLCLEARKNAIGQFYLGLEKCVESSLAQKWTFVGGLS